MAEASCSELWFMQFDFSAEKHKQFANICQHGVNKSDAGAARLMKRRQLSPHDLRLFSELFISTFHQSL